jgi:hypothetical protein
LLVGLKSPSPGRAVVAGKGVDARQLHHEHVLDRRVPANGEHGSVLPGWVVVRCATRLGDTRDTVELAMSAPAYTGLATWIESAPPGQNINIA